jgi:hypothetical protein
MRQNGLFLVAVSALALYGPSASAIEFNQGFYGALGIGVSEVDQSTCGKIPVGGRPGGSSQFNCDDTDSAWSVIGGWQILKWVGVEAGYTDLGETTVKGGGTNISAEVDGFTLAVTPTLPISEGASLFVRGGAFFWSDDVSGQFDDQVTVTPVSSSEDDTSGFIGAGIRVKFTERFGIGVEWNRYLDVGDKDSAGVGESDIDHFLMNFIVSF